ncbi:MAG TPA: phosphoglycolate phosphatase [Burkholderiaceae bacterium]|nr:phosphoglycolate phosphatase [Burkholderiaceae bacterium]HNB44106.1 phosphoglycolate phosphatase [Burkholderiaceae bacterium]HNG82532.1 phosphoglycolate phosphatase [Burkholderiaceae bacterium]
MAIPYRAVLFDLDGTLVDSAPDLAGAGNDLRERRGLPALPLDLYRPLTGTGARGMLRVALGSSAEQDDFESIKDEYLSTYAQRMTRLTQVFADMEAVLTGLEARSTAWGVVTNKHSRFAAPLIDGLGLAGRCAVLVCGDSAARAKPHPDPLLLAAARLGLAPTDCLYVGDDLRDVQAGQAAGMATIAAGWGYLGDGAPIEAWGADQIAETPRALLKLLDLD